VNFSNKQLKNTVLMAAAVRFAAETAKRKLSTQAHAEMSLLLDGVPKTITITQEQFETQCKPLLERLRTPIERALRDARLRTSDLDEVVLTDVCPHSLGVRISEEDGVRGWFRDIFLPIIERNTVIPASCVRSICTIADNQAYLNVEIYQGESRSCSNNVKLGTVSMAIPPKPAGEVSLNVRYTHDINGILDVDLEVKQTGTTTNLVIKDLAGNVSDADIESRRYELAALKIHPRDQEENRLLLERANRLYEQFLGYERQQVGQLLSRWCRTSNRSLTG
jgi:molecular chaperone HscC